METTPPKYQQVPRAEDIRGASRLYALLCELSLDFTDGEVLPYLNAAPTLHPEVEALWQRAANEGALNIADYAPPEELRALALPQFAIFRDRFETIALRHIKTCTRAITRAQGQRPRHPSDRAVRGLGELVNDVRAAMADWKLADERGNGPLVGPFTAALIRGAEEGRSFPVPRVHGLLPVADVGSGGVMQTLSLAHRIDSGEDPLAAALALGFDTDAFGAGRPAQEVQLVAARVWSLHRVGKIPRVRIAAWRAVSRHQVDNWIRFTDRALMNGLPARRPNAREHHPDRL